MVAGQEAIYNFINGMLKVLRTNPRARPWVLAVSTATTTVSVGAMFWILFGIPHDYQTWVFVPISIGVLSILVLVSALLSYAGVTALNSTNVELQTAEDNRREIAQKVLSEPANPYAHVELGAAELRVFYTINQGQARSSFRFGVVTVLLGLIFLLVGVALFYSQQSVAPAALSAVGGVIAEFIGGTSLYLYNRVQVQSSYYHDYLGQYQRLMLAVSLCTQIEDENLRDLTRRELAMEIVKGSIAGQGTPTSDLRVLKAAKKADRAAK